MKWGYARVSTKTQSEDRQIAELKKYVDESNIKIDKASGKDFNRENYLLLKKDILRKGDELYIKSLDRFGRDKDMIKEELKDLKKKGIIIRILDVPTTLINFNNDENLKNKVNADWIMDMINNILIEVLGAFAEHERNYIKLRQKEGIAQYKLTGKTKTGNPMGRPSIGKPLFWDKYYRDYKDKKITANYAMKMLNLKRNTFYKLVKEEENK